MKVKVITRTCFLKLNRKEETQQCYYVYKCKVECYKGKEGKGCKDVKYTRTVQVDQKNKFSVIVAKLLGKLESN